MLRIFAAQNGFERLDAILLTHNILKCFRPDLFRKRLTEFERTHLLEPVELASAFLAVRRLGFALLAKLRIKIDAYHKRYQQLNHKQNRTDQLIPSIRGAFLLLSPVPWYLVRKVRFPCNAPGMKNMASSDEDAIAVVNFMLNHLRNPAGIGHLMFLKSCVLIRHFNGLIARCTAHAAQ